MAACLHCGEPVPSGPDHVGGPDFCCGGCAGAHGLIKGLGFGKYYERRCIDPDQRRLRPEVDAPVVDYTARVLSRPGEEDGATTSTLYLMVEGLHCAACVWLIESVLAREPDVETARVNMTTRRLVLTWRGTADRANDLVGRVTALGYRLVPYDPALLEQTGRDDEKQLLRAMAVAGFAAGNVMLFSVSIWAGYFQGMMASTRDLLHWASALVALPAIVYAGLPFYRSAVTALKAGRLNMDVPISLAVILAGSMSLYETITGGAHAYFDSAVTLLFFLLIGRYLDRRARGRAHSAAEQLVAMGAGNATVILEDGSRRMMPPSEVAPGMTVLVAAGERVPVDGQIVSGTSDLDTSLITGETVPALAKPGDKIFAGAINLSGALHLTATASGEETVLAEIVRLMEAAEQGRARYVAIADRVARLYAPVVHLLALAAFLYWLIPGGQPWQSALLIAVSVLIITCPCALALAVPVVQVIASGRLLKKGVLLKEATALERLARVNRIVFDKTGTLTTGRLDLIPNPNLAEQDIVLAVGMAATSTHPLARALARAYPRYPALENVQETPGSGLSVRTSRGEYRLGSRDWCAVSNAPPSKQDAQGPEIWLKGPKGKPVRFGFRDQFREDAEQVVAELWARDFGLSLLTGDREPVVRKAAEELGIEDWHAGMTPLHKTVTLDAIQTAGGRPLMVGDGLNDAPALAAAYVSLSPSSAADISQTAADAVFQGDKLAPVLEVLGVARRADGLVKQNFGIALIYNMVTIPLAMAGHVTPLVAAIAMSSSSIAVIANALRLTRGPAWRP
ncbi:MAG: heavy metal translocating P-type ATPase metal-binding domain-containing protein [Magnetospiraceae bacterium]